MQTKGYNSGKPFLYIDPLKQGLKHAGLRNHQRFLAVFLYIDPLKQGLKHELNDEQSKSIASFYT